MLNSNPLAFAPDVAELLCTILRFQYIALVGVVDMKGQDNRDELGRKRSTLGEARDV